MPPPRVASPGSAENARGPASAAASMPVSAAQVDAASAWPAVAAAAPMLSSGVPTARPGTGGSALKGAGPSSSSTMTGVASTEASS